MLSIACAPRASAQSGDIPTPALPLSPPPPSPNYHLVGWINLVAPGSGQMMLGDYARGLGEGALSISTATAGFLLSPSDAPLSLDGTPTQLPEFTRGRGASQSDLSRSLYGDMLQEFGIKYHMTNTFVAYREAARRRGVTQEIDQRSAWEMFTDPFKAVNLLDPWVYVPLALLGGYTAVDYYTTREGLTRGQRLTPYTNFLYTINYGAVQPLGSGAPEEMFYRGFVQTEAEALVPSPWFAIAASTAAFAFSHAPGHGRLTAAVAGAYLGYLSHRFGGNLAPGITLHYWAGVLLGAQTILLNHDSQRSTPPASFYIQVNY